MLDPQHYFNGTPVDPEQNNEHNEITEYDSFTGPGFVARSRKAFVAGTVALSGALALAIPTAFGDGVVSVGELVPIGVAALGVGLVAFFGTWGTPNA